MRQVSKKKICEIKKAISIKNVKTAEFFACWHVIFIYGQQANDLRVKPPHGIVQQQDFLGHIS